MSAQQDGPAAAAMAAWPSDRDGELYRQYTQYGVPPTYTGGQPVTPVERVLLDLLDQVENSIFEYRSVLPPRYELDDTGADRAVGAVDALQAVFEYLTGRPGEDAIRIVVEVLRDRGRRDEIQPLEAWARDNPVREPRHVDPLQTFSEGEDAALARLRPALAGPVVSSPTCQEPNRAAAESAQAFFTDLARSLCEAGQTLSVSAAGVAIIDLEGDEVSVLSTVDLPRGFAAAHDALTPTLGEAFPIEPRPHARVHPPRVAAGQRTTASGRRPRTTAADRVPGR